MEINTVREIVTVICFAAFVGIVYWAYSARNKTSFDEAARIPFDDELDEFKDSGKYTNLSGAGK